MLSHHTFSTLAAGLLLSCAFGGSAAAQIPTYSECGELFTACSIAPPMFRDSLGNEYGLENYGSFQEGAQVLVEGTFTPCFSVCLQGQGCITGNTIVSCASDPTTAYCDCDAGAPCGNTENDGAGCENGTGTGGLLNGSGSTSVALDNLVLTASQLPPNEPGLFYMGPGQINSIPFGDGQRCVGAGGGSLFRYPIRFSSALGIVDEGPIVSFANSHFAAGGEIDPGETWNFQYWYRDPNGPCGSSFNLTNAVSVDFEL